MQKLISKTKATAISIAILLTVSMVSSIMLIQNVNAHIPAWNIPTYSFISVSPNPIGDGQTANVNFWSIYHPLQRVHSMVTDGRI